MILATVVTGFAQQTVEIRPTKDNTLYDSSDDLSNGGGSHIFIGTNNNGEFRRGVIQFDVASNIPAGSTIDSVMLTLHVSRVPNIDASHEYSLHRLLADWGEGGSDAGSNGGRGADPEENDATWFVRFFPDVDWEEPGGDFASSVSATQNVPAAEDIFVSWSSEDLIADVQGWLDDSATNFGWIIIGDESTTQTARRFDSRENSDESVQPVLRVSFSGVVSNKSNIGLSKFDLYPNPARDFINISFELQQRQDVRLTLHNLIGQTLYEQSLGAEMRISDYRIDLKDLQSGIYFVRLHTPKGISTRKIVVE